MSEATSVSISPPASLTHRLAAYLLCWLFLAALVTPLAVPDSRGAGYFWYRFGMAAWSAHVLIVAAVLTLSVPSLVVAFQLALLAALLQGYLLVASTALWAGEGFRGDWDQQIQFALVLGLCAALGAVFWLLVRVVWKMGLSPEAAAGAGRSGQLGLRELLYIMASLSALLAFVSSFSLPGIIPVEQVLAGMLMYAVQVGPLTVVPLWLALHGRSHAWHWRWVVPLMLLYAPFLAALEFDLRGWGVPFEAFASLAGIVLGTAVAVAANAVALHVLGLTWKERSAAASSAV